MSLEWEKYVQCLHMYSVQGKFLKAWKECVMGSNCGNSTLRDSVL